jgi:enamine deaminase RidA (YjgF/YER057c/UK114 family)
MQVEKKLAGLGHVVPDLEYEYRHAPSVAKFFSHVAVGNLLYLAGSTPSKDGKQYMPGVVGKDLTVEQAREAMRQCCLVMLAHAKYALGDLDRISRFVQMVAYINSAPGFVNQPPITNAATELLESVFGERGLAARASIGCQGLANNHSVELVTTLEFTGFEVHPPLRRDAFAKK